MTVQELIEILQDMPKGSEVRLAFQPTWPLQFRVGSVAEASECDRCDLGLVECAKCDGTGAADETPRPDGRPCSWCQGEGTEECDHSGADSVVYLGEGGQCSDPYLPGAASIELGWREAR